MFVAKWYFHLSAKISPWCSNAKEGDCQVVWHLLGHCIERKEKRKYRIISNHSRERGRKMMCNKRWKTCQKDDKPEDIKAYEKVGRRVKYKPVGEVLTDTAGQLTDCSHSTNRIQILPISSQQAGYLPSQYLAFYYFCIVAIISALYVCMHV